MSNKKYTTKEIYTIAIQQGYIDASTEYTDFYYFIRNFNKRLSDIIMEKAYKFDIGFGIIHILKSRRKGETINWGESNKYKKLLIEQGVVPFDQKEHPNGVKWFIYYTDPNYYLWNWFKNKSTEFIGNMLYWKFNPMADNRKNVGKAVKKNPFADLDYGLYK